VKSKFLKKESRLLKDIWEILVDVID